MKLFAQADNLGINITNPKVIATICFAHQSLEIKLNDKMLFAIAIAIKLNIPLAEWIKFGEFKFRSQVTYYSLDFG
ncbi:MAG: hypothetical protein GY820_42440 [Gammaproteobacteria bacterium]|nr:hypothetical protein [Gammaproteobacteria bacterium]